MSAALRRRRPVGIDRERWPARRWSPVGRDVAWRLLPAGNDVDFTMGNYTWARILDHCADVNGALLHAHRRASLLGPRAATPGVAANSGPSIDVSSTAHCAASTGRVPGLGGVSSSPVHRAFVLVLGANIAVLLDCSKSSRQCSLSYLLTY